MSTKFHDAPSRSYFYFGNGRKHALQLLARKMAYQDAFIASDISDHYFKVYRIGEDMCAMCQKPRSEHPRVKP